MKLAKAMATVAGLTGLSRVAGFIRDILTAVILGAGPMADAFFVALKLPNLFRRITAEGAFSVSFVPMYSETLEKEGAEKAAAFANNTFAVMLWSLLGFTLAAMLLMPYIITLIAPGFLGDVSRMPPAIEMARITFPYLLLMSVTALMGGMLNAHERFVPFAAAPILFNLSLIVFLLLSGLFKNAGMAMVWGVFFAGVLQCGLLWHNLKKTGLSLQFAAPRFGDEKLKRLFILMGPGIIGAGVMHINLLADMIIASFLESGSVSYLYYADRLNQLPLGMVGIAVGTALLPMMSKAISTGERKEAWRQFNKAMELCMLLALPAAVGLFMASMPIIMTLFRHGLFGFNAAAETTSVLTAYALGVPAYIAVKIYSTAYWAHQDTMTPVKASIISTVFNIFISVFLVFFAKVGVMGIAVGTAMAGWLQIVLLARGLKKNPITKLNKRFKWAIVRIILACAVMAGFLYGIKIPLVPLYLAETTSLIVKILGLVAIVGGGVAVYGVAILATGVVKVGQIKKVLGKEG